jgi:1-acyl-sn-glycerol-3-phosphate acyltransferase
MKRVPPKPVRRLVVGPLVLLLDVALLALSPVLLGVAALLSPLFGGARPLRMTLIVLAYARYHLETVLRLYRLGRSGGEAAHYEEMRRFVAGVYDAIVRFARVEVRVDESSSAFRALSARERPVVLLSRHAGEGDTLLVIHELLCRHGRMPRVVMHTALQLDPLIDLLGNRLPNRFVDPRGGDTEKEIAAMAQELDRGGALVIFPEGGNFSHERRRRGIERLLRGGHEKQAAMADAMQHVIAPRPGGALAAIDAAPEADVVVMGHVGFPTSAGEVWKLLPHHQPIELELWHEPADSIPSEHGERIGWLFERWRRLDAWVDERSAGRG